MKKEKNKKYIWRKRERIGKQKKKWEGKKKKNYLCWFTKQSLFMFREKCLEHSNVFQVVIEMRK